MQTNPELSLAVLFWQLAIGLVVVLGLLKVIAFLEVVFSCLSLA